MAANIHSITPEHRHCSQVYFATTQSTAIVEPDGKEKSGGCLWLTKEELLTHPDIHKTIKLYGAKALEILAP